MTKLLLPPFIRGLVNDSGVLTEESRVFFSDLVDRVPSYGDGSPEGVVEGVVGATYYDLAAAQGSRVYLKIVAEIDGDAAQGWELS